jgi:D-glycero-D-manno-heptose 1,7-bisphosphate phosphatase
LDNYFTAAIFALMKIPHFDKSWTLFLDRDGVINHRLPGAYVRNWEEFDFMEGVPNAIAAFSQIFGRIVVVTNQQGIGKGLMTAEQLVTLHDKMYRKIIDAGGRIDAVYFCPKLAIENPICRKPEAGMAYQAQRNFPEINFKKSVMVGDSLSDMGFGSKVGMWNVLVETNEETGTILTSKGLRKEWYIDLSVKDLNALSKIFTARKKTI